VLALPVIGISGPKSKLIELAIRDQATLIYTLDEESGDLLNVYGTGNDCQVDAVVTRPGPGRIDPYKRGYSFSSATGSAPLYGHCEGTRPDGGVMTNFALEVVCRKTSSVVSNFLVELRRGGGFTLSSFQHNAANGFNAAIFTTGNNSQVIAVTAEADEWAHYVVCYRNGNEHTGYRNGTQKYTATPAGSAMTDGSPFGLAIGGIYQNGTGNPDAEIDFVAIYQGVTLTAEQAEEHYLAANITP
jgi:hypothetical protein